MVGINSAIASRTGGYQGISFAIPSNLVQNIARQLIKKGAVARGYLGVRFQDISPALASDLDVPRGAAQIANVVPGSAADEAGLQQGAIITGVNGDQLSNFNELKTAVGSKQPGDEVQLTVVDSQSGEERTVTVTLGDRPDEVAAAGGAPSSGQGGPSGDSSGKEQLNDLGLSLRSVTPRFLKQQRLPPRKEFQGAVITNVEPRSYAYQEAELRQGLIITHLRVLQARASRGGEVQSASSLTALRKPS
ncbi:MAG: hypothetical protein BRD29_00245 [Bacteroidetes bacterium QH_2_67_10]|nr:MAG: hypothetical protein BRD29_00245 [Bacteroidetes bacterium QH_2_67_10]